jgi:YbbR domain-containing protein
VKKNIHIVIISIFFSILLWGSISLSKDYYITVDIPVRVVNFPGGYSSATKLPEKISAKIRGNGWKLVSVNLGSDLEYIVSANNDTGKKYINLFNSLSDNQWLASDMEVLDLNPDTLSIYIEKVSEKKVAIEHNLDLSFKDGYGLASNIIISPDSITLTGPVSLVKKINSIQTEKVKLAGLDAQTIEQVKLENIRGMNYNVNFVTVDLDVQKIVDKNFDNILVSVIDIPGDREVVLLPNRVSIGIRGGINILGKLNEDRIRTYVYYRNVVLDTLGSVKPHIDVPPNTSLIYIKPERLRYIIKKYN